MNRTPLLGNMKSVGQIPVAERSRDNDMSQDLSKALLQLFFTHDFIQRTFPPVL
jgi:hypothetical protein